jgi:hypothetical protein
MASCGVATAFSGVQAAKVTEACSQVGIADAILISATRLVCMFSTTKDAARFTSGKRVKGMPDYSKGFDLTNATF